MARHVEEAIRIAQDAVRADEACDFEEAVALYTRSVESIKRGLQVQREDEAVDNTVLHRYLKLYSERIAVLGEHRKHRASIVATATLVPAPEAGQAFSFDDAELERAAPPPPAPADEWRRPFWLMRTLRASMAGGGYLSADGRVYVPRRVWLQKGARFVALGAKLECAECLVNELRRLCAVDRSNSQLVLRELQASCEMLGTLQNSLSRLLPYVPDSGDKGAKAAAAADASAVAKLSERMKGLAKSLDKTAARLGTLPTKCADPNEYIATLVDLFDAAAFVEAWIEHFSASALEHAVVHQLLHRVAAFLYEVVCAFVIQDLNGLLERHVRKASAGFLSGRPLVRAHTRVYSNSKVNM